MLEIKELHFKNVETNSKEQQTVKGGYEYLHDRDLYVSNRLNPYVSQPLTRPLDTYSALRVEYNLPNQF